MVLRCEAMLYLARHATPDWNMRDIRYDIPPGPPLVPQGEAEAAQLGEFLRQAGVVQIYVSPLVRTNARHRSPPRLPAPPSPW